MNSVFGSSKMNSGRVQSDSALNVFRRMVSAPQCTRLRQMSANARSFLIPHVGIFCTVWSKQLDIPAMVTNKNSPHVVSVHLESKIPNVSFVLPFPIRNWLGQNPILSVCTVHAFLRCSKIHGMPSSFYSSD